MSTNINNSMVNICWLMNYSRENSRQCFLEAEICYWLPLQYFSQLGKAYNISLTDATIARCISMAASTLTLFNRDFRKQYNVKINYEIFAVGVFRTLSNI